MLIDGVSARDSTTLLRDHFTKSGTIDDYAPYSPPLEPVPYYTGRVIGIIIRDLVLNPIDSPFSPLHHPQAIIDLRTPHPMLPWWMLINVSALANVVAKTVITQPELPGAPGGEAISDFTKRFIEPPGGFFGLFKGHQKFASDRATKFIENADFLPAYIGMDKAWVERCVEAGDGFWIECKTPPPPAPYLNLRRKYSEYETSSNVTASVKLSPDSNARLLLPYEALQAVQRVR